MSLTADVEGVDRLADTLAAASAELLDLNLTPLGTALVDAALPRTPRRTGKLAQTVRASVVDQTVTLTAGAAGVDYATYVHAANPWLAKTITDQTDRAADLVTTQVVDVVGTIQGT